MVGVTDWPVDCNEMGMRAGLVTLGLFLVACGGSETPLQPWELGEGPRNEQRSPAQTMYSSGDAAAPAYDASFGAMGPDDDGGQAGAGGGGGGNGTPGAGGGGSAGGAGADAGTKCDELQDCCIKPKACPAQNLACVAVVLEKNELNCRILLEQYKLVGCSMRPLPSYKCQ